MLPKRSHYAYTERCKQLKRKNNKYENMFFNVPMGTGYKR